MLDIILNVVEIVTNIAIIAIILKNKKKWGVIMNEEAISVTNTKTVYKIREKNIKT